MGVPRAASPRRHVPDGIDVRRPFTQLEMQLRLLDVAGLARLANDLPALDGGVLRDRHLLEMRVSRGVVAGVADDDHLPKTLQLVAGEDHGAVPRRGQGPRSG